MTEELKAILACGNDVGEDPFGDSEHGVCVGCDRLIRWRPTSNPEIAKATKLCMNCARSVMQGLPENHETEVAEGALEDWLAMGHSEEDFYKAMKLAEAYFKLK